MKVVVFDAGALIGLEPGDSLVRSLMLLADEGRVSLITSSAVVAQVWRGGARQARLSRLFSSDLLLEFSVPGGSESRRPAASLRSAQLPLDPDAGRRIGLLAWSKSARDVVDGHVALIALERDAVVVTSDPNDISRWGVAESRILRC